VEYQQLYHLRRLKGLPLITLDPPFPLLRCRLDKEGSFEAIEPHETVPDPNPMEYFPAPEDSTISYLEDESFKPTNPLITDFFFPLLIQIVPPKVTSPKHQFVRQEMMEATSATFYRSSHTPILATMRGGVMPPLPPPPIRNTVVQTPTTSGSGIVPSMTMIIVPYI
jgi:hypothetical protein